MFFKDMSCVHIVDSSQTQLSALLDAGASALESSNIVVLYFDDPQTLDKDYIDRKSVV